MTAIGPGTPITAEIRLIRCLGRGGMGSVWVADSTERGVEVVVKLLDESLGETEVGRARFIREAEAAAKVRSPHVVATHDFGISDQGAPYIVMELLEGHDLGFELRKEGVLSPALVAHVLDQVATALTVVHEHGVVHRDVKPGNIFLCATRGPLPLVKLLDFGIAKVVAGAELTLTTTGEVLGTPLYMSPEQLEARAVDYRTDLWSLGVVAFRALTGKPPFTGESVGQIVTSVLHRELPSLSRMRGGLPSGLDAWFRKACAREPEDRFQSAREMADAFAAASRTEVQGVAPATTTVPPPTQGSLQALGATITEPARAAREEQARRRFGSIAALVAAVVVAALFFTEWRSRGKPPTLPRTTSGDQRVSTEPRGVAPKFVAVGRSHTCTIMKDDSLRCWGANADGQLGVGDQAPRPTPTTVPGLSNVVFVSIGQRHTCAATLEGRVYCWGAGSRGQLGDGTTEEVRSSPALVKSLGLPARKVQCGKEHTCVELKDGTAQCWGSNELGELGDGTKNDRALPTKVEGVRGIRKLSVGGGQHACAALTNGEILCWGSNTHGQLGLAAGAPVTVPTRVQGLPAASKVYVGLDHSCALLPDATTQCWGANDHGQLGDGTTNPRATPAPVFGLAGIESLAVGWQVTCAAMTTGTVQCWGANDHGQLGIGSLGPSHATPTVVQGITHSSNELSVKGGNACTIAEDRTLRCWGWNDEGQLGDGTKEPRPAPVSITM